MSDSLRNFKLGGQEFKVSSVGMVMLSPPGYTHLSRCGCGRYLAADGQRCHLSQVRTRGRESAGCI